MAYRFKLLLLATFASICMPSSLGLTPAIPEVAQVISLNDVTSQGLIRLPSHVKKEEDQMCNYWITFLNDMSDDVREHHKNFGISIVALDYDVKSKDSIFLMAHPLEEEKGIHDFENVTWDSSTIKAKLEFNPIFQDVCINLNGDWESSEATLVVTMFFDTSKTNVETCPTGMTKCECSGSTRCILPDLNCNGVSNCGIDCQFDESEYASCPAPKLPEGTRLLSLNYMAPQGVLSLPPSHPELDENVQCHYWISFLRDMPVAARQFHKDFGISVQAMNHDLKEGDSLFLLAHPIDINETSPHDFERVTWDSTTAANQLEFKSMYQDVCIRLEGDWKSSKTTLAVTFFYDKPDSSDKTEEEKEDSCGGGMVKCDCSESTRCISDKLLCNGVANCGIDCQFDESEYASCPAPKLPGGTRLLSLSEMTPQGVLSLPPSHPMLEDDVQCHYWVSFLRDLPVAARQFHKDFGISIQAVNHDFKQGDSIFLLAHPIDINETNPHDFERVTWDLSTNANELEFKSMYQDVCIKLKGAWESSKTTLAVTFYYDNTNMDEEKCPEGMTKCKCSSGSRRCISENLLCNGVDNCDIDCEFDETELASCPAPQLPEGMRVVVLDEVTSQGVLNLPPSHPKLDEGQLCHYWISFLKKIPANSWEYHKNFGISVRALNMALKPEDSIFLMGHPVDGNNTIPEFETVTWDSNSNSNSPKLEFKPMFQDVCIKLKGEWERSKATLVVTFFYDNTGMTEDYCPVEGMTPCKCSRRCIYNELLCNGVGNCGSDCEFDETEDASCKSYGVSHSSGASCTWANFEYLLMMVMTGLLLILIPAVFLLTFMYHKRANMARSFPAPSDGNNNVNRNNGQYPHVITMSPPNDIPPRYDELPAGVKVEPRENQQPLHS